MQPSLLHVSYLTTNISLSQSLISAVRNQSLLQLHNYLQTKRSEHNWCFQWKYMQQVSYHSNIYLNAQSFLFVQLMLPLNHFLLYFSTFNEGSTHLGVFTHFTKKSCSISVFSTTAKVEHVTLTMTFSPMPNTPRSSSKVSFEQWLMIFQAMLFEELFLILNCTMPAGCAALKQIFLSGDIIISHATVGTSVSKTSRFLNKFFK